MTKKKGKLTEISSNIFTKEDVYFDAIAKCFTLPFRDVWSSSSPQRVSMRNWHRWRRAALRSAVVLSLKELTTLISAGVSAANPRRLHGNNHRQCPVVRAPRGKSPPKQQRGGGSLARPPAGRAMLSDGPQATGRSAGAGGAHRAEQGIGKQQQVDHANFRA